MEAIPDNNILQFNPDTLQAVRKEYGLDKPGRMDEAINILEDWVKKQDHFVKKDFSRKYLEITLISSKGLIERAKMRLDKLCTLKSLMPNFFQETDIRKLSSIRSFLYHGILTKLTQDNYRIYVIKITNEDFDSSDASKYYKNVMINSEYFKMNDYSNGFIIILDVRDINPMTLVTKINIIELRQTFTILIEGYGVRIKGIHIITPSKMVDALVSILKQVLSPKISGRISVHKSIDTLYDSVPKEYLPADIGGDDLSLKTLNDIWMNELSSNEFIEILTEMNKAATNEAYRQTDEFNENYLGVPGSFRSFNVD